MDTISDINLIHQDFTQSAVNPKCIFVLSSLGNSSDIAELTRARNTFVIQSLCNRVQRNAIGSHFKDTNHNRRNFLVNIKGILFRVSDIAVRNTACRRKILSAIHLRSNTASDLLGDVLHIGIIHNHLERQEQCCGIAVFIAAVIIIIDANESDTHHGKNLLYKLTGHNKMSAQTRNILYDNTVDLARAQIVHHSLE